MEKILDLVGANIIWGFILLMIIGVNSQMNDYSFENINTSVTQLDAIDLTKIIEYDFRKAGMLISGDKISIADSNQLKFYFDKNSDGSKDSIRYSLGDTTNLKTTKNPNDKPVYRKFNDTTNIVGSITELKFEYLDSLGQKLTYASLLNQFNRNKIKIFKISLKKEGMYINYDSVYPAVDWVREIKPKNL